MDFEMVRQRRTAAPRGPYDRGHWVGALETLGPEDPQQVGRYKIVAQLGSGGMGRVYLARSPGGRPVAVKVVRPELARDTEFRRRFKREVTAAQRVNGAFTAGVIDADPDGSPAWLATVYVPGPSLGEAITTHGPWPPHSVLPLAAGLVEALEVIHAAGVIHRDLKPSNVLLAADGPRIIDFGISVAMEASPLTRAGMLIGTPGFMSPEQLTDQPVSPASDVFALGAVLTYTATGVGPFGTGTPNALHFRTVHEQPKLDTLPPELRDVVAACLAKEPDQRPTVATLLDQLTNLCNKGGSGQTTSPTLLLTEPSWMPDQIAQLVQENDHPSPLPETHPAAPGGSSRSTPERWSFTYGEPRWWFLSASAMVIEPRLAVARGLVYVGSNDARLYALDAEAPVERWSFTTGGWVSSSPTVAHGVVYVGSHDSKLYAVDAGPAQYDADRQLFPLADHKRPYAKAMVYVVDGTVKRIRAIDPMGDWVPHGGDWEIPVTAPLTPGEIAEQFPTLGFSLGDELPAQRGKLRQHLAL